jgi:Protein of unknown function (DUF3224)
VIIGSPVCDNAGGCIFPFEQHAQLAGDFTGTSISYGAAATPPNGRPKTFSTMLTSVLMGSFANCGQGTVIMRRWENVDPTDGAGSGRWEIVPGIGSGQTLHLGGAGTIQPAAPQAGDVAATFDGNIECDQTNTPTLNDPLFATATGPSTITASASVTPPPVGTPLCDKQQQHCLFPSPTSTTYMGDLSGTSVASGVGYVIVDPTGYVASSMELFRGSVGTCGQGTLAIRTTSRLTGTHLDQQWQVVAGYNTGALVNATGSGTSTAEQLADHSYAGQVAGRIDCG